jgi:hypothetical protein
MLAHPPKPQPTMTIQSTIIPLKRNISIQLGMNGGSFTAEFYTNREKKKTTPISLEH